MRQGRGLFASPLTLLVTILVATAIVPPVAVAPEGQVMWAVHISLAPTWFDPAESSGITTRT